MSKKISVVLIALTLLLGFTYTAKAEVQNVKLVVISRCRVSGRRTWTWLTRSGRLM